MDISKKIIGNIIGSKRHGGKNDWDGDGIRNKKDCQPRNTMRQDSDAYNKIYSQLDNRWRRISKLPWRSYSKGYIVTVEEWARRGARSHYIMLYDRNNNFIRKLGERSTKKSAIQFAIDYIRTA